VLVGCCVEGHREVVVVVVSVFRRLWQCLGREHGGGVVRPRQPARPSVGLWRVAAMLATKRLWPSSLSCWLLLLVVVVVVLLLNACVW
jgi:hypothetical protein